MACQILPFPQELRPRLPTILANVDYSILRARLEQIDRLLLHSGVERDFIRRSLDRWVHAGDREPTESEQIKHQNRSRRAIRCNLLRTLLQEDFRGFSCPLAGNPLYRWFCGIDGLEAVSFLSRINRPSIEMTQQARRAGGKKGRKRVLRQMKKPVGVVEKHARRHRDLLDREWEKTKWTRPQAERVLRRIDTVLALLPEARRQAHERIFGERPVENSEKLPSLYDTDVRVIVRGKPGAEVEFGSTLLLGENRQGVIVDFHLFRDPAPGDSQTLFAGLVRVREGTGRCVEAVVTDRGFHSAIDSRTLNGTETYDGTCPRNPAEPSQRMEEEEFARLPRRRAQTEGRIGILKRGFLGRPMRAKGFGNREMALSWGVLTHNLWVQARMRKDTPAEAAAEAA